MVTKNLCKLNGQRKIMVTFTLPASLWAGNIYLVGDFNEWRCCTHPMQQNLCGEWEITLSLDMNRAYQFRYLVDKERWMNDDHADAYVRNLHGSDNFVVITDPNFEIYEGN